MDGKWLEASKRGEATKVDSTSRKVAKGNESSCDH